MTQSWTRLTYLHWPTDPDAVAALLPAGARPDLQDGAAWVGLIAFAMRDVRVLGLPRLGYLSHFLETNVRTYCVDEQGRPGVAFLSLDADRLLPVAGARMAYRLPYIWSRMGFCDNGDELTYTTRRRGPNRAEHCRIRVRLGGPTEAEPIDHFLTARYSLQNRWYGGSCRVDIAHAPWPLRRAELLELDDTLVRAAGLPAPTQPPRVLFSEGVAVALGPPRPRLTRG